MTRTWQGIVGKSLSPAELSGYMKSLVYTDFDPQLVVIHNTQIPTLAEWKKGGCVLEDLLAQQRWFRDTQKWSAGPHLYIDDAQIWVFTPLTVAGVHSPSWNGSAWGIEVVGNFDIETLGDEQKHLLLWALAVMHRDRGWTEPQFKFHKDDPRTTHKGCPGKNIDRIEIETKLQFLLTLDVPIT